MNQSELNRRDFTRLAMAAFGGTLAATVAGCAKAPPAVPPKAPPAGRTAAGTTGTAGAADGAPDDATLAESIAAVGIEKHVCRGLNACKNAGGSGENDCAGQGTCATVEHHSCSGQNDCKGQGGCGGNAVENECKTHGGCHVPVMDNVWKKARKILEAKMKKEGKAVGPAPAKT
ncbi:MAG: hypothetical protein EXS05_06265 [Planctomycetaceae bacterium]|nr:hypothetical protein [Planctomycetaceae bacterium]